MKRDITLSRIASGLMSLTILLGVCGCKAGKQTDSVKKKTKSTKAAKANSDDETEPEEQTYEHNEWFDVVTEDSYINTSGTYHIVHIIEAKKDGLAKGYAIAYDENGNVVGKSDDFIHLSAGERYYFEYWFDNEPSDCSFSVECRGDYYKTYRRAVEVIASNIVEGSYYNHLYITVEQVTEEIGDLSGCRVILYKDGKIVGTAIATIEGLSGKGSTAVVDIKLFVDIDNFEFCYRPAT